MMNRQLLENEFGQNFAERGDLGASVSVWRDGVEVVSLGGGFQNREQSKPWTPLTPVLFWSATKGPTSACLLHACQEECISLSRRVAELWPEFAAAGKQSITIAELMSHQAGLAALSSDVSVFDHAAVAEALAAEPPQWPPGKSHGYHPRTFGFLVDELLRRITGTPLRDYWGAVFREPMQLDLWIGMEEDRLASVAPVFPARNGPPKDDPFYTEFFRSGSLTARAFSSPKGLHSVSSMNAPEARTAAFGAFGGIGTASSLAKFYAMLANGGEWEGRRFFRPETLAQMSTTLVNGPDRVLILETAFSAGFMKDPVDQAGRKLRTAFGPSLSAFGHPGAGGSHAFADPENRLSFAYVMNQMEPSVLPGIRSLRLVDAVYAA